MNNMDPIGFHKGLKVFYDGQCIVCSKEIDVYKRKDIHDRVDFVDISSPLFDASQEGLDPKKVRSVFHVKSSQGRLHTGVDGFVAIWDTLEIFSTLSALAKSVYVRPIFDLGYFAFTKVRPLLPRRQCHDGSCDI